MKLTDESVVIVIDLHRSGAKPGWRGARASRGNLDFRVSFFFSSRRRHTRSDRDWSSDVCSSDLRRLASHPATPGNTVMLSLDIKLQKLVEDMFGDRRGALVAIDPKSGEVLAFVSKPDRKSTRLNSSHDQISYAVFCLKKKTRQ